MSIYLARRGNTVTIYERRSDMRKEAMSAGRSINLALSDRGIKALEEVGIMDEIRKIAIPMHGRQMHSIDGSTPYQAYGKEGQFINSVSRGELNCKLMDLAEANDVEIVFNQKCERIDWTTNEIYFVDTVEENTSQVRADLIFGSDGAYSAARLTHQLQHDRFQYDQFYIDFGYKELNIPAGENGAFFLEQNALHIWPRGNYMLIALPNKDGSFTCTLFFPFEGDPSFKSLDSKEKVRSFFDTTFADASKLMPTLENDFFANPTSSLITVKCFPWIRNDKFALIGDAAHAIVPFFGQGMNCGFEDCSVLNGLLAKERDWAKVFSQFSKERKQDSDKIADMAVENFVEMRDKVGDARFLMAKNVEKILQKEFPGQYVSRYSLVSFSRFPYGQAYEVGLIQNKILEDLCAGISRAEDVDLIKAKGLIQKDLTPVMASFFA